MVLCYLGINAQPKPTTFVSWKVKKLTKGKFKNKAEIFDYNEQVATALPFLKDTGELFRLESCDRHITTLGAATAGDKFFSIVMRYWGPNVNELSIIFS